MTTLGMIFVALVVWPLAAYGLAVALRYMARVTADRLTRRPAR